MKFILKSRLSQFIALQYRWYKLEIYDIYDVRFGVDLERLFIIIHRRFFQSEIRINIET